MAQIERRDKQPEPPKEEPKASGGKLSRRDFLIGGGTGVVVGIAAGTVLGREVFPKAAPTPEAIVPETPAAEGAAPAAAPTYKAGFELAFDPTNCTGCMKCAVACSEKYGSFLFPDQTADTVNLEFARIRPMRFQYIDVASHCYDCKLIPWAEGSDKAPCQEVCPQDAILTIPEGEGKEGYYGMGYKWIDREKCLGLDKCWRCAEVCEEQFGSGISFDPIEKKAQVCSRCGGDPECVKACPEPLALQWVPAMRNGRFYAQNPHALADLYYRKLFNVRRTL
jgi:anaerobic carbon-monoxide dehydrogenase iron sulfur subunit